MTVEHVPTAKADEDVGAVIAVQLVVAGVAGADQGRFAQQGQILLIRTEHVAHQRADGINARIGQGLGDVTDVVDDIDIVTGTATQVVIAGTTVEIVVATVA